MNIQDLQSDLQESVDMLWRGWLPRCLDQVDGGFFCDFDHHWRPFGTQPKLLEFQARHTMFFCELAMWRPQERQFLQAAGLGYDCLRSQMWDSRHGGWYHLLSRTGEVQEGHTKHAHGMAYAIQACLSYYHAAGDENALALAKLGFDWLEDHAHDSKYGGYYGLLTRQGLPITVEGPEWRQPLDSIGTPLGYKDLNVHSDLLETMVCLYEATGDSQVGARLEELVSIVTDRAISPSGALHFFSSPDWRPIPHGAMVGNAFQTICRLVWAGRALGRDDLSGPARLIWDWAQRCATDRGIPGFAAVAVGERPVMVGGSDLRARLRSWWVQFEALRAMLILGELEGVGWEQPLRKHWRFLKGEFMDQALGGVHAGSACHWRYPWQRVFHRWYSPELYTHKGGAWKDGSHDGRALLHALRVAGGESGLTLFPATSMRKPKMSPSLPVEGATNR